MAQISITIPDGVVSRLLDAISSEYDYEANKQETETKAQFAKRMLIENWAKRILKRQEGLIAGESARISAESAAESEVSIT